MALPKCFQLGIVRIFIVLLPGAALTTIVGPVGLFEIVQSFSHFKIGPSSCFLDRHLQGCAEFATEYAKFF